MPVARLPPTSYRGRPSPRLSDFRGASEKSSFHLDLLSFSVGSSSLFSSTCAYTYRFVLFAWQQSLVLWTVISVECMVLLNLFGNGQLEAENVDLFCT